MSKNRKSLLIQYPGGYKKIVDDVAKEWLEKVYSFKKYSTYIKYKNIYATHISPHMGRYKISQIKYEHCKELLQYEYAHGNNNRLSKSSINAITNVLKQILQYGGSSIAIDDIKRDFISCNQTQYHDIVIFSKDEQTKLADFLLDNMDTFKLGIYICLFTGLRLGEICALKTENILLDKRMIRVTQTVQRIEAEKSIKKTELLVSTPKTIRSIREIPICDKLFYVLKDNMPHTKYLVNGDCLMEPRTYQYMFNRYLKKRSIEYKNFHSLRHTFATNCIENGMETKCLSELLGHASVQTTLNKYVHPSFESKLKQINLLIS